MSGNVFKLVAKNKSKKQPITEKEIRVGRHAHKS